MSLPKKLLVLHLALALIFQACSSGSSSSNNVNTASTEEAAAAIGALMASFGDANQSLSAALHKGGLKKSLDASMEICNNLGRGPDKVIMTGRSMSSGSLGSLSDSVTVDADADFCQDQNGDDNSGEASIGGPLFASFVLAAEIEGSCNSGSVSLLRGQGISRNTDTSGSFQTEIYGRFDVNGTVLNCTFYIDQTGTLDSSASSCSDDLGSTISLAATSGCVLEGDVDRLPIPSTIEGHYAISNEEGYSVAADCNNFRNMTVDSDQIVTIENDCADFTSYGFNLDSFNIGFVVTGDENAWAIYRTGNADDVNGRIKLTRLAGFPILASIDMLYVANYDPADPGSVQDGEAFPEALIGNATFQQELGEEISAIASEMEDLHVEIFCPMSEPERIFGSAAEASSFLQGLLTPLASQYTGSLMWIGYSIDEDPADYDLTGFDYAAVNISPMPSHTTSAAFEDHVEDQLDNLGTLAGNYGIPFLISNAGVWGEAIGNAYDWGTQSHALEAFQIMTEASDTAGAGGIIYWEGASGEVLFTDYPDILDYITEQFN